MAAGAAITVVLAILGAAPPAAPQVLHYLAHRQNEAIRQAFDREIALYKQFLVSGDKKDRLQVRLALTKLSWQMDPSARALIPPIFSATRQFDVDLVAALVDKELEQ